MKRIARHSLISLLVFAAGFLATATADEKRDLFDGKSLQGWVKHGGKATFEAVDGTIVGRSAPLTGNTFLCTEETFGDFELTYEYLCNDELNSGVQIRGNRFGEDEEADKRVGKRLPDGRVYGYQVEIDPNKPERLWSGGIYDEARRGWLFPGPAGGDKQQMTEVGKKTYKSGQWNSVRVVCQGDHIQTWLNGVPRADFQDGLTSRGFIALQVHGVGARTDPLEVRFRNIQIATK